MTEVLFKRIHNEVLLFAQCNHENTRFQGEKCVFL
jgi:hypothetical protein